MANRPRRRIRQRPLKVVAEVAALLGAGLLFFAVPSAPMSASAELLPGPIRTTTPPHPPSPTQTPCDNYPDCSPSPSPSIIVISPVPLDPSPPPSTPSYLIGIASPSPATGVDTLGSPVPLGGSFNDQPTPKAGPVSAISDNSNHGDGLPIPFILLGFLFLVGAAGAILYAVTPRGERFPEKRSRAPDIMFTPSLPDPPELSLLNTGLGQRPRPRRRSAG